MGAPPTPHAPPTERVVSEGDSHEGQGFTSKGGAGSEDTASVSCVAWCALSCCVGVGVLGGLHELILPTIRTCLTIFMKRTCPIYELPVPMIRISHLINYLLLYNNERMCYVTYFKNRCSFFFFACLAGVRHTPAAKVLARQLQYRVALSPLRATYVQAPRRSGWFR